MFDLIRFYFNLTILFSGSMVGWPLTLAQKTASQILKLMSDNDFLGFIGISGQPTYLKDSQNNSIKVFRLSLIDFINQFVKIESVCISKK